MVNFHPLALPTTPVTTVRLVNGSGPAEGRVEYLTNGTWVTVCSDNFDAIDANVVCRELQSPGVTAIYNDTTFGAGNGSVYNESFQCVGKETALSDCPTTPSLQCPHSRDVGIKCQERVRLVNGGVANEGRLEVFSGGDWYSVCDNGFGLEEAQVVCRELGFLTNRTHLYYNTSFGEGTGEVFGSSFRCVGNETNLFECRHWYVSCSHFDDVSLSCDTGNIRLFGGPTPETGRLETYDGTTWFPVCSANFNIHAAGLACEELGFQQSGAKYTVVSSSGGVPCRYEHYCFGTEKTIYNCHIFRHPENDADMTAYCSITPINCAYVQLTCVVSPPQEKSDLGAIIGAVVGGVIAIVVVVVAIIFIMRRKSSTGSAHNVSSDNPSDRSFSQRNLPDVPPEGDDHYDYLTAHNDDPYDQVAEHEGHPYDNAAEDEGHPYDNAAEDPHDYLELVSSESNPPVGASDGDYLTPV